MDFSSLDTAEPGFLLLKRASRLLIKAAGGLQAAGEIAGRSHEQMRRYGDPASPESLPVHLAMRLEAECGQPYVTRALAEASGHALRPMQGRGSDGGLPMAFAEATMAGAEFHREVALAKADGVIPPNEENAIARAGAKAQAAIGTVLAVVAGATPPVPPPASPDATPAQDGQVSRPVLRSVGEGGR